MYVYAYIRVLIYAEKESNCNAITCSNAIYIRTPTEITK